MKMRLQFTILSLLLFGVTSAQKVKLVLPIGHTDRIHSANFSADGKYVVTASQDKTTKIWETNSGKLIHSITAGSLTAARALFTPDGKKVLTTSVKGNSTEIWNTTSFQLENTLEGHLLSVSANGKYIMTSDYNYAKGRLLRIWDSHSGRLISSIVGSSLAEFSPDGESIVAFWQPGPSSEAQEVRIWGTLSGGLLQTLKGHSKNITSARFSPRGDLLITASDDGTAKIWEVSSGVILQSLASNSYQDTKAQFSSDSRYVLTISNPGPNNTIKLWEHKFW